MSSLMCAIWDKKAEAYNTPFFAPTEGVALRQFTDLCADSRSIVAMHPEDFRLDSIAAFNELDGGVLIREVIKTLAEAVACVPPAADQQQ